MRAAALVMVLAATGCGQGLVDFFVGGTGGDDLATENPDLAGVDLAADDLARAVDLAGSDGATGDAGTDDLATAGADLAGVDFASADLTPVSTCSAAQLAGGADRIAAADTPPQDPAAVTVEAWIYPTALAAANQALVAHWHPTSAGQRSYWLRLDAGGHVVFEVSTTASGVRNAVSIGTVSAGAWTHVAGVFSPDAANASVRAFVNGTGTATTGFNALALNGSNNGLQMGNLGDASAPFAGYMSDVRVEGAAVYSANFTPPATVRAGATTLALYHLNETSGTTAADSATGANRPNNATLLNGAAFATPPSCH